jgi:hypothetical protein
MSFADSEVLAAQFPKRPVAQPVGAGLHVKLWLVDGPPNSEPPTRPVQADDVGQPSPWQCFSGRLVASKPDELVLQHAALGRIAWHRSRVARLEVVSMSDRTLFLPCDLHLGNELRDKIGQVRPIGPNLRFEFELRDTLVSQAWVSLSVQEMEAEIPGGRFQRSLEAGQLRTNLVMNGTTVDYLNHHLAPAPHERQKIRIPIPGDLLEVGKNRLELVQSPLSQGSDEFDDCEIFNLAVELDVAP